jgi:hypothetical protein
VTNQSTEETLPQRWNAVGPDSNRWMDPAQDPRFALREVILHMVEEYARHLGHADLLRERIDGRVGQ